MEEVYVARTPKEKALQRALLQYFNPKNRTLVEEALRRAGRADLIGNGEKCLIRAQAGTGKPIDRNRNTQNHQKGRKTNGQTKIKPGGPKKARRP